MEMCEHTRQEGMKGEWCSCELCQDTAAQQVREYTTSLGATDHQKVQQLVCMHLSCLPFPFK